MCSSLADDVQWVSWRGDVSHSRKQVEDDHATLFSGLYKNSHRTDNVKAIRFLTPDLASVDNYWSMTGAKMRDGSDWPYRAGYVNFLDGQARWTLGDHRLPYCRFQRAKRPTLPARTLFFSTVEEAPGAARVIGPW